MDALAIILAASASAAAGYALANYNRGEEAKAIASGLLAEFEAQRDTNARLGLPEQHRRDLEQWTATGVMPTSNFYEETLPFDLKEGAPYSAAILPQLGRLGANLCRSVIQCLTMERVLLGHVKAHLVELRQDPPVSIEGSKERAAEIAELYEEWLTKQDRVIAELQQFKPPLFPVLAEIWSPVGRKELRNNRGHLVAAEGEASR